MTWTRIAEENIADKAWARIQPIFEQKLKQLALALNVRENEAGIEDASDEEYCLVAFFPQGTVQAYVTEEMVRDGEGSGVGIMISGTGEGGKVLFTYAPYNYTPSCFTDDIDELVDRAEWFDPEEAASAMEAAAEEEGEK